MKFSYKNYFVGFYIHQNNHQRKQKCNFHTWKSIGTWIELFKKIWNLIIDNFQRYWIYRWRVIFIIVKIPLTSTVLCREGKYLPIDILYIFLGLMVKKLLYIWHSIFAKAVFTRYSGEILQKRPPRHVATTFIKSQGWSL